MSQPVREQYMSGGGPEQHQAQQQLGYSAASNLTQQNYQQQLQQMQHVEGQLASHGSKRNLQKKASHQNANSVRFRRQYMATGKSNLGTSQNLSNNSSFKSNGGGQGQEGDRQNPTGGRDKSVNQRDIHNRVLSNGAAIGAMSQINGAQQFRVQLHGQTISPKNIKNPSQVNVMIANSHIGNISSDLHLSGIMDFMGAQTGMYPNGIGSIMPNSVQNATTIRYQGNQSVTNAMQAQLITPKNSNFGGLQQFAGGQNVGAQHGAMIQGSGNNRINQVIKKHSINSGRTRGHMNSTTLRQEGNGSSNAARMIIKKTVSPSNDSMGNQQLYYQQQSSQQSTGQKFGSKLSRNVNAAQQVYQPGPNYNGSNLPISSRSNRNGMVQFANQNSRSKHSKNNLEPRKVPTPKNQGGHPGNQNPIWQFNVQNQKNQGGQNQVEFQIKKNSRTFGSTSNAAQMMNNSNLTQNEKQLMLSNNINSYREVLSDHYRSPHAQALPMTDFGIPNIGAYPQSVTNAQGVGSGLLNGSQKRNIQLTNLKMGLQQFPPVPGVGGPGSPQQVGHDASYTAVLKARQSVGKRSQNRTINDNPTNDSSVGSPLNMNMKTIDLNTYLEQNTRVASQEEQHNQQKFISNSQSSKQSVGMVSISQNSQHKKYQQSGGSTFPMSSEDALRIYGKSLSQYERDEIASFDVIYYLNLNAKHKGIGQFIKGEINSQDENPSPNPDQNAVHNHGFDNDQADYLYEPKEQINYRYEIQKKLGKGAFGVVVRCFDHKCKEIVALKILKNWKKLHKQGKIEIKILETLRDSDQENSKNIVRIKDSFTFRSHVFLSFEMLSINLYQFIKNNDFQGFSMALTKRFSIQVLEALDYMQQFSIVHCDLKPENILLVKPNKSQIKLIDYGSSCFELERFYTYIQSRFYRAPEIMLGIPYTTAIDMWSFGCIVFECLVGVPIFAGENENDQMAAIMEVVGVPPRSLIAKASRRRVFFDDDYHPILMPNSRGKVRHPSTRSLADALKINDPDLIEFMKACFEWKPEKRLKPIEALQMPWIKKSLSESRA